MPVWLAILLAVLALFTPGAVVGVWIGTSMSQRGAEKLANNAARREWRRQQVAPFRDAADQRVHFWLERMLNTGLARMPYKIFEDDGSVRVVQPEPIKVLPGFWEPGEVLEQLLAPTFYNLMHTVEGISNSAFRNAFLAFVRVEYKAQRALYTNPPPKDFHDHTSQITSALAALNEAAERYIFSPVTKEELDG